MNKNTLNMQKLTTIRIYSEYINFSPLNIYSILL